MSDIIVFAGPSVFGLDEQFLNMFNLRAPAVCGDMYWAMEQNPKAIAIIDGMFSDIRSVWHKEILYALDAGIPVYGAASLGALRAAECCHFGMVGIGEIFEDYKNGLRISDGDVAVLHAPEELSYQPVTIALADAEKVISRIEPLLDRNIFEQLSSAADKCHFQLRTWDVIAEQAQLSITDKQKLLSLLEEYGQSQKQSDALQLLKHLSEAQIDPVETSWTLQRTGFSERERYASLKNIGVNRE